MKKKSSKKAKQKKKNLSNIKNVFIASIVILVLVFSTFSILSKSKGRAISLPSKPDVWTTDWTTNNKPDCDQGLNIQIEEYYNGPSNRQILWTWTATKDGTGQIIGWDNDPDAHEIGHRAFHFPEGANINAVSQADWIGVPGTTSKNDDEHPYRSNKFLVTTGDIYQMRPGGDSIYAGFCFEEGLVASPFNNPWWQSTAGHIYGKSSIESDIPPECSSPSCTPYIITKNEDGNINSAGIPMTEDNSISSHDGYNSDRLITGTNVVGVNFSNLIKEDYAHFIKEVDLNMNATNINGTINILPYGATADSDNTEIYYRNNSLTIDLSTTQTVSTGKKMVIFVDGDLNITSTNSDIQYIDVEEGAFLAFIVKGNINIDPNVGNTNPTSTLTNLDGVFIADGTINVNGYYDETLRDKKIIFEGTLVGWSGFNLDRDFAHIFNSNLIDGDLNNTNPIEVFIFRPDLNQNIPDFMKRSILVWQEIN